MSYPKIDLNGAGVAITGGAQGIGRATAEAFAARGANVAVGVLDDVLATETAALAPEPAMKLMRRLMRDDRALRPDSEERRAYRSRLDEGR